jgi:uncharacterized protein YajQ (UPF0234 family)
VERQPKLKTSLEQTSMQRPQFVQFGSRITGGAPLIPLSAGRITCCSGQTAKQTITLREGIEAEIGKKLQRLIKDSKLKVQAAMQDKQVRVTGKSRDDLQAVMALLRGAKLEMPLQFTNFRD